MSLVTSNRAGVEAALRNGANPNETDFIEMLPLSFAPDIPTAKLLIHHGADVKMVTRKGTSVLNCLLVGADDLATFLLKRGAPADERRADKMTASMAAALNGANRSLKELIKRHANLNATDREGSTPLMFAVRGNQIQSAKILLKAGAQLNFQDKHGRTALHSAAQRGNFVMTQFLVSQGAHVGVKDEQGNTALHLAAKYSGDVRTLAVLKKATKNLGAMNAEGMTAADLAARFSSQSAAACFGRACATPPAVRERTADAAIRPVLRRVQSGLSVFISKAGCVACHHQGLGVMTLTTAAKHQYSVDKQVLGECFKQIQDDGMQDAAVTHAAYQDPKFTGMIPAVHLGDQVYGGAYILGALKSAGVPGNPGFGEGVTIMGRLQQPDGRFTSIERGIMEHSDFFKTGLTLDLLKAYWPANNLEELKRIQMKARNWATKAQAKSAEDLAGRLWILAETGAGGQQLSNAASELLLAQRNDGGWGIPQRPVSDSYTTGVCLFVLRNAAQLERDDKRLARAVAFLVRTQESDGSWYEPKLIPAFNNHLDAAFPHGYDQYASYAGTCWATMGLMTMVP